jgi:hypothetical protein
VRGNHVIQVPITEVFHQLIKVTAGQLSKVSTIYLQAWSMITVGYALRLFKGEHAIRSSASCTYLKSLLAMLKQIIRAGKHAGYVRT